MPRKKSCFVPCCKSTSVTTPNKIFLAVPIKPSRKRKWFQIARRDTPKTQTIYFCCEDHFNLEEDMENFVRYKLFGGRIILKVNVVPHIFDCQTDRKTAFSAPDRLLPTKLKRKRLVDEAIADSNKKHQLNLLSATNVNKPSTRRVAVQAKPYVQLESPKLINLGSTKENNSKLISSSMHTIKSVQKTRKSRREVFLLPKPSIENDKCELFISNTACNNTIKEGVYDANYNMIYFGMRLGAESLESGGILSQEDQYLICAINRIESGESELSSSGRCYKSAQEGDNYVNSTNLVIKIKEESIEYADISSTEDQNLLNSTDHGKNELIELAQRCDINMADFDTIIKEEFSESLNGSLPFLEEPIIMKSGVFKDEKT